MHSLTVVQSHVIILRYVMYIRITVTLHAYFWDSGRKTYSCSLRVSFIGYSDLGLNPKLYCFR